MKVKYIIDYKKYTYVECETEEEVNTILELNKDMEAFIKSEQRYNERIVSMDHISNNDGEDESVELPDNSSEGIMSILINKERVAAIYEAIDKLTARQKEIFLGVVIDNLSYSELATRLSISKMTVCESYNSALKKIKEIVKDLI